MGGSRMGLPLTNSACRRIRNELNLLRAPRLMKKRFSPEDYLSWRPLEARDLEKGEGVHGFKLPNALLWMGILMSSAIPVQN